MCKTNRQKTITQHHKISVTDQNGQPVAGAKVSFDVDEAGVSLTQSTSGSVLTGSDGQARVFLKPDDSSVSGAYTVSATASFNGNTTTATNDFSVQATNVMLSALTVDTLQLSSGAQTPISLKVTDTNGNALNGVQVSLNASCGQIPAQISSDADGMIAVIYKSINSDNTLCSGPVTISANTGNSIQSATVMVQAPEATSIVYTSDPVTLGIANSGSSATGEVEFTVFSNRTPLANADVILSLEKSPLGLGFCVENVTLQRPSVVVQLAGETLPPSAVKLTTVPSGTLLPLRSTILIVMSVLSPSILQSKTFTPCEILRPSCVTRELAIEIPLDKALMLGSLASAALISTGPGVEPG